MSKKKSAVQLLIKFVRPLKRYNRMETCFNRKNSVKEPKIV